MASLGTNIGRWIVSVLWCSCPSDKLFGWQRNIAADKQILSSEFGICFFSVFYHGMWQMGARVYKWRLFGWLRIGTEIFSHRKRPGLMEVKSGLRGLIAKKAKCS